MLLKNHETHALVFSPYFKEYLKSIQILLCTSDMFWMNPWKHMSRFIWKAVAEWRRLDALPRRNVYLSQIQRLEILLNFVVKTWWAWSVKQGPTSSLQRASTFLVCACVMEEVTIASASWPNHLLKAPLTNAITKDWVTPFEDWRWPKGGTSQQPEAHL